MNKKILFTIFLIFGFSGVVFASPYYSFQRTLLPIDSTENIGTSTSPWDIGFFNQICLSGDCKSAWPTGGSGASFAWPFSAFTNYVSTSTTLGFFNGLFSTASSTFSGPFYLPSLSQGFAYIGSSGRLNSVASSSINISGFNNDSGYTTNTGTVTSVTLATPSSSLTLGGTNPVTTSGTLNADINTAHTNTYSVLQNFNYSSTTNYASLQTSSTTVGNVGTLNLTNITGVAGNCLHVDTNGKVSGIGADCGTAGGEANTGATLGTGLNLYDSKSGVVLRFNSLSAGTNITLSTSTNSNTIVINSTASGSGNVSTSTNETSGQVPYWTTTSGSPAKLGSVATSSIANGTGITVTNGSSAYVIGSQPTINCNTATASVFGCLTSANWNTFNNKIGTSSGGVAGNLAMYTTTNGSPDLLSPVATSSLGVSAPITFSGTIGAQVGGVGGTFGCTTASAGVTGCLSGTDWSTFNNKGSGTITAVNAGTGLSGGGSSGSVTLTNQFSTSTIPNLGELTYWTGTSKFGSVATSSGSCSGFITCSGFTVVGSVSPTITTTGQLSVGSGGTGQSSFGQGWLGINDLGAFISSTSPTVNYITATSTTATSTFYNGINLSSNGCFSVNGTCLQTIITSASAYKQAAKYATVSILSGTPTYANGSSGVGATLTELGTGALSVDSSSPSVGDRVLVKNESSGLTNGIYTVTATGSGIASYVLTRATDYNSPSDVFPGVSNFVNSGTVNANTCWVLTNSSAVTIGTTALTYDDACGTGSFSGTAPINVSGTTISLNIGSGLSTSGSNLISLLATSTAETDGQLAYWTTTNGTPGKLSSVATTSVTCTGSATCSSFTVLGSSPITINATGGAASAAGNTNDVQYNGGSSVFAGSDLFTWINSNHQLGVGSTTPFATLSVHAQNGDTNRTLFAVASSTASATTTLFSINNQGFVGINTSAGLTNNDQAIPYDISFGNTTSGTGRYIGVQNQSSVDTLGDHIWLIGADGNGTGGGGDAYIVGGTGGGTSGIGGVAGFTGGNGGTPNGDGGSVRIDSGVGVGTGNGGDIRIDADNGGTGATGNSGSVLIMSDNAVSTNGNGGSVSILPGHGKGNGAGGSITLTAGASDGSGSGGSAGVITITSGNASSQSGTAGGALTLKAGDSSTLGVANGGTVTVQTGNKHSTGNYGDILFKNGAGTILGEFASTTGNLQLGVPGVQAIFSVSGISGSNKTFTFPNTTGTLALTSIAGGGTNATSFPANVLIGSASDGLSLIATSSDLTVNSLLATSTATSTFIGPIAIGSSTPSLLNGFFTITAQENNPIQANIQNKSAGSSASSDWVATSNNGSDSTHYIDVGIDGSTGGVAPFTTANHAYIYSIDDPLNIGALGASSFITFNTTGGTSPLERARITSGGNLGIATTTSPWLLNIFSTTAPQLALSVGGGQEQVVFRNDGTNFYIATTTVAGNATTSLASFTLANDTGNLGLATTTPFCLLCIVGDGTRPLFAIASTSATTSMPVFQVDKNGHQITSGAKPAFAASSCGTGPSVVGSDVSGKITIGSGTVKSCSMTFNSAYGTAPACIITGAPASGSTSFSALYSSTTTTTLSFMATSTNAVPPSMPSWVVSYYCIGNQ